MTICAPVTFATVDVSDDKARVLDGVVFLESFLAIKTVRTEFWQISAGNGFDDFDDFLCHDDLPRHGFVVTRLGPS